MSDRGQRTFSSHLFDRLSLVDVKTYLIIPVFCIARSLVEVTQIGKHYAGIAGFSEELRLQSQGSFFP